MTYNGWTNYETWTVGMFLDGNYDGPSIYHEALELVEEHDEDEHTAASALEAFTREHVESDGYDGLRGDLLGAALSEVNWRELAEAKLSEVREASETPNQ